MQKGEILEGTRCISEGVSVAAHNAQEISVFSGGKRNTLPFVFGFF